MSDGRTGTAAAKLVEAIRDDIAEINDLLGRALAKMRTLESSAKGVNGLASRLKAKGNDIENTIATLAEDADSIGNKMLDDPKRPVIVSHVNEDQAAKVAKARTLTVEAGR